MEWQDVVPIAQVFGPVATGLSAIVAVATYHRSQLQRQGDTVREIVYQCELDFSNLVREYDHLGVLRIIGEIVSHPNMRNVAVALWEARSEPDHLYIETLTAYGADIDYVIRDAMTKADTSRHQVYDAGFRRAAHQLWNEYPLLHSFLLSEYYYALGFLGFVRWPEKYESIITFCLRSMRDSDAFRTLRNPDSVLAYLHGYIRYHLNQDIRRDNIDGIFGALQRLMTLFVNTYKDQGDLHLSWTSQDERYTDPSRYNKASVEDTLVALVEIKALALHHHYREALTIASELRSVMAEQSRRRAATRPGAPAYPSA